MYRILLRSGAGILPLAALLMLLFSCGEEAQQTAEEEVLRLSGTIEEGDPQDPEFGNRLYDAHIFEAKMLDTVMVSVDTEDFSPVLTLEEVSTGAQIDERDPEYSAEECLTYVIAGPGEYEARVYSEIGGGGDYQLTISILR